MGPIVGDWPVGGGGGGGFGVERPRPPTPAKPPPAMKYFVGLLPVHRETLTKNQVDFTEFSLDGQSGILLDAEASARAIAILNLGSVRESRTNYEGVLKVEFTVPAPSPLPSLAVVEPSVAELDAEHEKFKLQYMAACSSREDELTVELRETLVARRKTVESAGRQLVVELRALMLAGRKARGVSPVDREALLREYEALLAVPKVQGVISDTHSVTISTAMLCCVDPATGTKHDIGEFQITIYLDGEADCVRWSNQTGRVNALLSEQAAPAVLRSGRALFSDIRENFPDLIAQMQLASAAALAIAYIEEVSGQDMVAEQVARWPVSKQ